MNQLLCSAILILVSYNAEISCQISKQPGQLVDIVVPESAQPGPPLREPFVPLPLYILSPQTSTTPASKGPETTKKPGPYLFTLNGAIKTFTNIIPEEYRPNATELGESADSVFVHLEELSKVIFCNPFFAGLNAGSCFLLYNTTVQGLQG